MDNRVVPNPPCLNKLLLWQYAVSREVHMLQDKLKNESSKNEKQRKKQKDLPSNSLDKNEHSFSPHSFSLIHNFTQSEHILLHRCQVRLILCSHSCFRFFIFLIPCRIMLRKLIYKLACNWICKVVPSGHSKTSFYRKQFLNKHKIDTIIFWLHKPLLWLWPWG